jgi:serine/alanine racemase
MENNKGYPYIDDFRIVAALLVIAIHVSPLLQIYEPFDFLLTRGFGRMAVPFFLMISGFFFFRTKPHINKLKKILLSLLQIYLIAIILYLPLQIYQGYFVHITVSSLVQDILLDGTMYHLWYLPASMVGLIIGYLLVKYLSIKQGLFICIILYLIGLGGDAYYQIIQNIPYLKTGYQWLFSWMEYTRNGLFMAPIFIYLGYLLTQYRIRKPASIIFTIISFIIMFIEAFWIHQEKLYRHDSMYLCLPIVTFFLCQWLLSYRGKRHVIMKDISLLIYTVHPLIIAFLHIVTKAFHVEILFTQQWVQYLLVTSSSFLVAYVIYKLRKEKTYGRNKRLD